MAISWVKVFAARTVDGGGAEDGDGELRGGVPYGLFAASLGAVVREAGVADGFVFTARNQGVSVDVGGADVEEAFEVWDGAGGGEEVLGAGDVGGDVGGQRRPVGGAGGAVIDVGDAGERAGEGFGVCEVAGDDLDGEAFEVAEVRGGACEDADVGALLVEDLNEAAAEESTCTRDEDGQVYSSAILPKTSRTKSRCSLVWAAVTQRRRRAAPWATAGNMTGAAMMP